MGSACIFAITSLLIEQITNQELLELNKRRDNKKKRKKGNYGGEARVMNQEIIDNRKKEKVLTPKQQEALERKQIAVFKREILCIGLDVFTWELHGPKTPKNTPKKQVRFVPTTPPTSSLTTVRVATPKTPKKQVHIVPRSTTPPPSPSATSGRIATPSKSRSRLIVKLQVRVTTEELSKGRWRPATSGDEHEVFGRGRRVRRAPKR